MSHLEVEGNGHSKGKSVKFKTPPEREKPSRSEDRQESFSMDNFNSRKYSTGIFSNNSVIISDAQSSHCFEPLPYFDKLLFDEAYGKLHSLMTHYWECWRFLSLDLLIQDCSHLGLNVNPFAETKRVFLPKVPVIVTVEASVKGKYHIFNPYLYKIKLQHATFEWEVKRTYKELKSVHRTLAKFARCQVTRVSSPTEIRIEADCPVSRPTS